VSRYRKRENKYALSDGGWDIVDSEDHVIAQVETETLADHLLTCLDGRLENALDVCRLLIRAYELGRETNGSVDWEDLDQAHDAARAAVCVQDQEDEE
jgi:hypothetical protein